MRSKGFTLIELLVVIAIIAILAAILFPVFTSAKENAKQTTCLKHGQQLGNALNMYLDDHGGKFPLCWTFNTSSTLTWAHGLAKYTKSLGVFTCPSVPNRRFTASEEAGLNNDADRITGGWGYNTSLGSISTGESRENGVGRGKESDQSKPQKPYSLADITAPTQHVIFGDSMLSDNIPRFANAGYKGENGFCDVIKALVRGVFDVPPDYRHNGGAIFIFCDGHAKWIQEGYFKDWEKHSHHWFVDNRNH